VQCPGHQEYFGGSWRNREQCEMTLHWLEQLLQEGWSTNSIAILTPYRAQLELLQRELKSRAIAFHDRDALDKLTRGTVHRLQGHELDSVICSSVVTQSKALRFLNIRPNLLNVAISRARIHFMTLGCASTLASGEMTRWLIPENSRPDHPDA